MVEIKKWLGLRNTTSPERYKLGELQTALDVEIDDTGKLLSRLGQTVMDGTASHSLYSNDFVSLIMHSAVLKRIENDFTFTTLRTLSNSDAVSYETYNNSVFYSNGTDLGHLVGSTEIGWGVTPPVGQPTATASTGGLRAGRYLYAITFVREDGHESGTDAAQAVDVAANGGITFDSIETSTNALVCDKILYLSEADGETLYRAAVIPNGQTSYTYSGDGGDLKVALRTQHASPPPAGNIVRYYNGVMYVVDGDVVYFSDPYNPELFRMATNFLRFPGQVAMFESVENGLYVATTDIAGEDTETATMTWFLGGSTPEDFTSKVVYDYGVISGTAAKCTASLITAPQAAEAQRTGEAVIWTSRHGVCIGFHGGTVVNITEPRYSFPTAQSGAGMVRQHRGFVQYVSVLKGTGSANNIYS